MRRIARLFFCAALLSVLTSAGAQTFAVSLNSDAYGVEYPPIQASDGNLYGVTQGAVLRITLDGAVTNFYKFSGVQPVTNLLQATDGNFYGVDQTSNSYGIYRLTLGGVFTQLVSSLGDLNDQAPSPLIQGADGALYGICCHQQGYFNAQLYRVSLSGAFSLIYIESVASQLGTSLLQGSDGNFYTLLDSFNGATGSLVRITPKGSYSELAQSLLFYGDVVGGPGGSLYGVSATDEFFSVSLSGNVTPIADLSGSSIDVVSQLFYASDGNFYIASDPLNVFQGQIVQITPAGKLTQVATLPSDTFAGTALMQASNGSLYAGTSTQQYRGGVVMQGPLLQLAATPQLPAPVQVTVTPASVKTGQEATLTWNVVNATTDSERLCFASGAWSGVQNPSGSLTISQATARTYSYALTCGGSETGTAVLTVGSGATSTVTAIPLQNPVAEGQAETFSVTVSAAGATPTGTVQLVINGSLAATVPLSAGEASLQLPTAGLAPGSYPYTVAYNGDATYTGAFTSGTLTVAAGQASTVTTLTSTSQTLEQNQNFSLTAKVTPAYGAAPTGQVSLYLTGGATPILVATLTLVNGSAILSGNLGTLPVGEYYLYAAYKGTAADAASTSPSLHLTVLQPTTISMTATPDPIVQGNLVELNATVTPASTGTVVYHVGTVTIATGTLGTPVYLSTAGVPLGTYDVQASYLGGGYSEPSGPSAAVAIIVIAPGSFAPGR